MVDRLIKAEIDNSRDKYQVKKNINSVTTSLYISLFNSNNTKRIDFLLYSIYSYLIIN